MEVKYYVISVMIVELKSFKERRVAAFKKNMVSLVIKVLTSHVNTIFSW